LRITSHFKEVFSAGKNLEKCRAEAFLFKVLLNSPERSESAAWVEEQSDEEVEFLLISIRA